MLLSNNQQEIITDGYPYLGAYNIHTGSVEGLDVQMLLYPFEKQFNFPSFFVQFGDSQGFKFKVVREKVIDFSRTKILIDNKPNGIRVLLVGQRSRQSNALIEDKSSQFVNLSYLNDFINHVVFGSRYKKCVVKMKMLMQNVKLYISLPIR